MSQQKKKKAPKRAFREISFDRAKIKSQIGQLGRVNINPYESLILELYISGCLMVPELISCIYQKEQMLYSSLAIKKRISDKPYQTLLVEIAYKLKEAEIAIKMNKNEGTKICCELFWEAIEILDPHRKQFDYVDEALMHKLIAICKSLDGKEHGAAEVISRIYYKYAFNKYEEGNKIESIRYLRKSFKLAKCRTWPANPKVKLGEQLRQVVGRHLATVMIEYGHQIVRAQPNEAIELAHNATIIAAELGSDRNMVLMCNAFLSRVCFLLEKGDFEGGRHLLKSIEAKIIKCTDYKYVQLNIYLHLYKAEISYNFENYGNAILSLKKALRLCSIYEHKMLEAHTLLNMAKVYGKTAVTINNANECFEKAKKIYIDNNDLQNKQKVKFLQAKHKADKIMNLFIDMIKDSSERYCDFYNLRQWKNRYRPFWTNNAKDMAIQSDDGLFCLLNEEKEDNL